MKFCLFSSGGLESGGYQGGAGGGQVDGFKAAETEAFPVGGVPCPSALRGGQRVAAPLLQRFACRLHLWKPFLSRRMKCQEMQIRSSGKEIEEVTNIVEIRNIGQVTGKLSRSHFGILTSSCIARGNGLIAMK